jgi:hypothetical protein
LNLQKEIDRPSQRKVPMSLRSTLDDRVKETPILFRNRLSIAIQEDRKNVTRRVVKPQPPLWANESIERVGRWVHFNGTHPRGNCESSRCAHIGSERGAFPGMWTATSPYGGPGDRLWARESHYLWGWWTQTDGKWHFSYERAYGAMYPESPPSTVLRGFSGDRGWYKRPSIFMPRWASRLLLEITDLRAERLQAITNADILAEGLTEGDGIWAGSLRAAWIEGWNDINGKKYPWEMDPWVWRVAFKLLK